MSRKRERLVPEGAVECFEIRAVLWFTADGEPFVTLNISDPSGNEPDAPDYEVYGVWEKAREMIHGNEDR